MHLIFQYNTMCSCFYNFLQINKLRMQNLIDNSNYKYYKLYY